jgi:hypothetical protein
VLSRTSEGAATRRLRRRAHEFHPLGCDAVAPYPYAHGVGPAQDDGIDWAMTDLLPYMLDHLRARGWDPAQQPLIGIPQTFRLADGTTPTLRSGAATGLTTCRALWSGFAPSR